MMPFMSFSYHRCAALTLHFLYAMKRNPTRLIEILVWPTLEIVLFSFLALAVHQAENQVITVGLSILAGLVFWNFFSRIVQESIAQFMDDVISKNIQNILVTPVTLTELVAGLSIAAILKMIISIAFLSLLIFGLYPPLLVLIGTTSLIWIGILISYAIVLSLLGIALIMIFGTRLSFIGSLLSTGIQIFACAFYPRNILPPVLYQLSFLVPISYVFESIRNYLLYKTVYPTELLLAALSLFLTIVITIIIFKRAFGIARERASLTKI